MHQPPTNPYSGSQSMDLYYTHLVPVYCRDGATMEMRSDATLRQSAGKGCEGAGVNYRV